MTETKLRKATFKYVENELRSYHATLKEIAALREEIMHPHSDEKPNTAPGYNSARVPGDPTGSMAVRLANHRQLKYLEQITCAIGSVYDSSPEEYKKLIQLRYWGSEWISWDSIAAQLFVSRRQALRWRDDIVNAIAGIIGLK